MLCSSCSVEVRPVVAVDIDGTLGDYHETFKEFCGRYFDKRMPPFAWHGLGEFEDFLGLNKLQYREAKLAYRQGGNKRWMPVYNGAQRFCREIRQLGAELWLATSRPWQRLDNIDPDTRFWLDNHSFPYDFMLYGDDKYQQLVASVERDRIVAVVDDLPEQARLAIGLDLPFILRDQPHNEHFMYGGPRGQYDDILVMIMERMRGWKYAAAHG